MTSLKKKLKIKGYHKKTAESNRLLMNIFEQIQDIRINKNLQDPKIIKKLLEKERDARKQLLIMLKRGEVRTADDFYRAAILFQHDESFKSYALAMALSTISCLLGERWGRSLSAAAIDRFLLSIKQKQIFGTNFEKLNDKWRISLYQKGVSDELRKEYDMPPLKELQREVYSLNKLSTKH